MTDLSFQGSSCSQQNNYIRLLKEAYPTCERPTAVNAGTITPYVSGLTTKSYTLSSLTPETDYQVGVQTDCGGGDLSLWRRPTFTTTEVTPTPSALACTGYTATTATLSWTENGEATAWQVSVLSGSAAETIVEADSNPFTVTGLTEDAIYTFKVRATKDGLTSHWTDAVSVQPTDKLCLGWEGTTSHSSLPYNSQTNYTLSQQIYTTAELGTTPCSFTSVDFLLKGDIALKRTLDIYMVQTDKTTFDSSSDWITFTTDDRVFSGEVQTVKNAWTSIAFDTPFMYDGLHNVVLIVYDKTNYQHSSISWATYSTDDSYQALYGTITFTTRANPAPAFLQTNIVGPYTAEIEWSDWGDAEAWQLCVNGDEENLIDVTEEGYTLTGLTPETEYTVKVRGVIATDDVVIMAAAVIPAGVTAWARNITIEGMDNGGGEIMARAMTPQHTPVAASMPSITLKDGGQLRHATNSLHVIIEKNIGGYGDSSAGGYHLLAPPTHDYSTDVDGMTEGDYDLYEFTEAPTDGLEWRNFKAQSFWLFNNNESGYLYANSTDRVLAFNGESNMTASGATSYSIVSVINDVAPFTSGWRIFGNTSTANAYVDFGDIYNDAGSYNSALAEILDGKITDITLQGRTLYKDGEWNTICLPFNVVLEGSPLEGYDEADAATRDITAPVFTDVTVVSGLPADRTITKADGHVKFIGYYDAFNINPTDNADIYYMTAGNTLKHTGKTRTLKACRAYFQFSENIVNSSRQFVLDFGDDSTTGVSEMRNEEGEMRGGDEEMRNGGEWYTIGGVKLDRQPTKKGVYIHHGRKEVVK